MQTDDHKDFSILLIGLGEIYGKTISEFLMDLYWQALESFDWPDVDQAFRAHVHNSDIGQFFPKPADIIRWIEGSSETKALQAWTKVTKAMTQVGAYQSLAFDDALIHAVLEDMGGWVKLCAMTTKEMPFLASEFQKRYRGYCLKKPQRYPKYLWGISERENAKNGYEIDLPILIGNASKAKEVFNSGGGVALLTQPLEKSLSELVLQISSKKFEKGEEE